MLMFTMSLLLLCLTRRISRWALLWAFLRRRTSLVKLLLLLFLLFLRDCYILEVYTFDVNDDNAKYGFLSMNQFTFMKWFIFILAICYIGPIVLGFQWKNWNDSSVAIFSVFIFTFISYLIEILSIISNSWEMMLFWVDGIIVWWEADKGVCGECLTWA